MDKKVTHLLTPKAMGIDQLEGFDVNGDPGPFATKESACKEVKRLTNKVKEAYIAGWIQAAATFRTESNITDEYGLASTSFDEWNVSSGPWIRR